MSIFLIKAAQLILALSILVIIHEFGHFLFARLFGVRVEKFYIFFDPWKEIFSWKPGKYITFFGKKHEFKKQKQNAEEKAVADLKECPAGTEPEKEGFWKGTEYGIGWLPFGGYCKISGMIDESMDTEQMAQPAQKWEFRSKPAWQRLLIMVAGVLFNFLLAIIIYAGIVYATGEKYVPVSKAEMGYEYPSSARAAGFRNGDIPLTADGKPLDKPGEARVDIMNAKTVTVLRNGTDTVAIKMPKNFVLSLNDDMENGEPMFMTYRMPTRIIQVVNGEGAAKAGVEVGDMVIAIDSIATPSLTEFRAELDKHPGKEVALTIVRPNGDANDTIVKKVQLSEGAKMGVGLEIDPSKFFPTEEIRYNLLTSVPRGIEMGVQNLTNYASSMKYVFTKEGAKSIGGFGSIGSIFPESWDWIAFWNIAAFLSVALAFMNFLPIPALDGGHILFLLIEVITRRKVSEKVLTYAQVVGMTLLILLLLYANGMDIVRLFK